jgi:hypothetical protein
MNVIDAKNFLFTLYKIRDDIESLDVSIAEAEARLSEKEVERVQEKVAEIKK